MGFINVFVESECNCSVKNDQFVLNGTKQEIFPFSDLNSVMIDNQQTTLTAYTLAKLVENNVAVYICNQKHLPIGHLFASDYYTNITMFELQIGAKKPLLNQIWKNIIQTKIENQAKVLELANKIECKKLETINDKLQSGDKTNIEAVAASVYFKSLFGKNFARRNDELFVNSCLNYGYAILRGLIARTATAHNLLPFLGIEHKNFLNNFNLIDDLIEVFRPIVDLFVYENINEDNTQLTPQIKHALFNIQNMDVKMQKMIIPVHFAIDMFVISFVNALKKNDSSLLKFPQIMQLKVHRYE